MQSSNILLAMLHLYNVISCLSWKIITMTVWISRDTMYMCCFWLIFQYCYFSFYVGEVIGQSQNGMLTGQAIHPASGVWFIPKFSLDQVVNSPAYLTILTQNCSLKHHSFNLIFLLYVWKCLVSNLCRNNCKDYSLELTEIFRFSCY